ncbi:MAG: ORF6N domain-containing protein [Gammaproteobacteria bacterium]|nr:MAG: ORF6N domain-containing protein [Gammaproteobacteria bacterium]
MVAAKDVAGVILILRGHRVLLDEDLARLYGVETRVLVQAVKRNPKRFPKDFMLQLNAAEWSALRSQIVISKTRRGGRRYAPYAFTEQGVAMLSSATAARPKGSSPNVRSTSIQEVVCPIQPPHQIRQRRLKGDRKGINHSMPAAGEPSARARPGSAPRDPVPVQRRGAKPSAPQGALAWFPSRYV